MTNKILELIKKNHALAPKSVGDFETFEAKGMTFKCSVYNAEGLGHVSVMRAKGFFGLMKMDTVIINPKDRDLPLLSYDRVYAAGNDTFIVELYDTMASAPDMSALDEAKKAFSRLAERNTADESARRVMKR